MINFSLLLYVAIILVVITLVYKIKPHKNLGDKKPSISFFPKFKTKVNLPPDILESDDPEQKLELTLSRYGFTKKAKRGSITKYSRGHLIGDLSIKLAKVNLLVTLPYSGYTEISIEAGWVVAVDTGDFWEFLTELKEKIENK